MSRQIGQRRLPHATIQPFIASLLPLALTRNSIGRHPEIAADPNAMTNVHGVLPPTRLERLP